MVITTYSLLHRSAARFFVFNCIKSRKESTTSAASPHASSLWVWGSADHGQLGTSKKHDNLFDPTPLSFFNDKCINLLCSGSNHTLAFTTEKIGYSWGDHRYGRLGLGKPETLHHHDLFGCAPTEMLFFRNKNIVSVGCGGRHSVACIEDGSQWKTYSWGLNNHGQCGLGDNTDRWVPTEITVLRGEKIISIGCGEEFTVLSTASGQLVSFGRGSEGQLGRESTESSYVPVAIRSVPTKSKQFIKLSSGWGHTVALSSNSEVITWGSNLHGQCGNDIKPVAPPTLLTFDVPPKSLVGDVQCAACLTIFTVKGEHHELWITGSAGDGKLAGVSTKDLLAPQKIPFFSSHKILRVACGSDHIIVHTDKGLFGWGYGQHGVLGLGERKLFTFDTPMQILPKQTSDKITRITVSPSSPCNFF